MGETRDNDTYEEELLDYEEDEDKAPDSVGAKSANESAKKGAEISVDVDVIPSELWCDIYARLDSFSDRVNFRSVHKSWRTLLPPPRHPPCLLLDETVGRDETPARRHFISLEKRKVQKVDFRQIHGAHCVGSSGSWILTVDEHKKISLTNLFSRDVTYPIPNDGVTTEDDCLIKVVLSSPLCDGQSCSAVAVYDGGDMLAVARPGDTSWTIFPDDCLLIKDIIFHKQEFYVTSWLGKLMLCNIGDDLHPSTLSVINDNGNHANKDEDDNEDENEDENNYPHGFCSDECLVEWSGKLLAIEFIHPVVEISPNTSAKGQINKINIYMLDLTNGKHTVLKSIGEHSLLVGLQNNSVSVLASDYFGLIRKNCIYFLDDNDPHESTQDSYEVRVFDVEDKSISTYYKGIAGESPPVWIVPSPTTI